MASELSRPRPQRTSTLTGSPAQQTTFNSNFSTTHTTTRKEPTQYTQQRVNRQAYGRKRRSSTRSHNWRCGAHTYISTNESTTVSLWPAKRRPSAGAVVVVVLAECASLSAGYAHTTTSLTITKANTHEHTHTGAEGDVEPSFASADDNAEHTQNEHNTQTTTNNGPELLTAGSTPERCGMSTKSATQQR